MRGEWTPASLRLIAITDSLHDGIDGLASRARLAVSGGATMLQLRLMGETPRVLVDVARALLTAAPSTPLIVSGRADVALAAGADGVYVGSDDLTAAVLRRAMPSGFVIGASVGDETDVARSSGADFVGIGPVFSSGTHDSGVSIGVARFATLALMCGLPAVAIGGVSAANVARVMAARAAGVAVISALFASADPMRAAREMRDAQDASGS